MRYINYARKTLVNTNYIKIIYTLQYTKIRKIYVVKEIEDYYVCNDGWNSHEFKVEKQDAYDDTLELRYIKWVQRAHAKSIKARAQYLKTTKMTDYRDRYMVEFPEKTI